MNKKVKKKNPLKLKACAVALSLWGLSSVLALYSSPVMAAETASNRESQLEQKAEEFMAKVMKDPASKKMTAQELQNVMAFLLNAKGNDLVDSHHYEEALATFNYLIKRFGNSHDPKIQILVAQALFNKGTDLAELHRIGQARAEWEELVYRFKDNPDVDIQKDVATARHLLLVTRNF